MRESVIVAIKTGEPEITWLLHTTNDVAAAVAIDAQDGCEPWSEAMIRDFLKIGTSHSRIITVDGRVVGFCLYEFGRKRIIIHRIAIHRDYRRRGLAKRFLTLISGTLIASRRLSVDAVVRESNLPIQLTLRASGFHGAFLPGHYRRPPEGGLLFRITNPSFIHEVRA